jgi:hypothetical protein
MLYKDVFALVFAFFLMKPLRFSSPAAAAAAAAAA